MGSHHTRAMCLCDYKGKRELYAIHISNNSITHSYVLEQLQLLMETDFILPKHKKKRKREVYKHR